MDQTETIPIVRKVDVMYFSFEGIEKSIDVKKKNKKKKSSILLKNCRFLKFKTKFAAEDFGSVNFKNFKNFFYDHMVHAY